MATIEQVFIEKLRKLSQLWSSTAEVGVSCFLAKNMVHCMVWNEHDR